MPAYEMGQARSMFNRDTGSILEFMRGLSQLIHEHREYEYEVEYYSGEKGTLLIGTELRSSYRFDAKHYDDLSQLPYHAQVRVLMATTRGCRGNDWQDY